MLLFFILFFVFVSLVLVVYDIDGENLKHRPSFRFVLFKC